MPYMAFSFSSLTRFSRPTLVVKFVSSNFRYRLRHYLVNFKVFCTLPFFSLHSAQTHCRKRLSVPDGTSRVKVRVRVSDDELKYKWLDSLSYPFYNMGRFSIGETAEQHEEASSPKWIMGIDPDISGALAILKEDSSGYTAQVFDNPILQVLVGKRVRKRLDASSIVQLLHRICAPPGTKVYIEQAFPLPQDGRQGCWCVGFTFGLWIGILVASGYSVVPIAPRVWKNHFQLYGSSFGKDDSRRVASMLFPSISSSFKRKKDHGRAEALLIAACGKGLKLEPEDSIALVDCNSNN